MPVVRRLVLAIVVAVAFAGAETAVAATPTPATDSVNATPAVALDVLANDSDPDGDALSVVSNSQPAHGTATCSALGACFYTGERRLRRCRQLHLHR